LILHSVIVVTLALDIHIVAAFVIESRCVLTAFAKSSLVKASPKSFPTAPGLKMGGGDNQKEGDQEGVHGRKF
jgi:hypothetical protein